MCHKSGVVVKKKDNLMVVMPVRCKSWSCPDCSKMRRRQLIAEAKEGAPNRFITLTVNPNWFDSPEERARRLVKAWRAVLKAYSRAWPKREREYLAVFELTKRGEPHLHICWRGGWVDQKWLSTMMRRLIGAPIVDVRKIQTGKKVAEYITKYISKRNIRIGTCKRYWRSKKYLAETKKERKARRNKGCTFWILQYDYASYVEWCSRLYSAHKITPEREAIFVLPGSEAKPPGSAYG